MAGTDTIKNHAAFIWSVADLLRGDYKQSEYGRVILPLTVMAMPSIMSFTLEEEIEAEHELRKLLREHEVPHPMRSAT